METITSEEIDILIESLTSWESKDFSGELMGTLLESMFSDKLTPEQKLKRDAEKKIETEKRNAESRMRKEISVLLKAKLIQIKQNLAIKQLQNS